MAALPNPYSQYRQTQVQTASAEQLVLMLYDGAIRFSLKAGDCIARKDMTEANNALIRVQEIIDELMIGVNPQAGQIAEQLTLMYDYLQRRATEANLKKDPAVVQELLRFFREMRSTWAEAIALARHQVSGGQTNGRV